ncbi:hypothetical protein Bca4012_045478 [Brassica carinata]
MSHSSSINLLHYHYLPSGLNQSSSRFCLTAPSSYRWSSPEEDCSCLAMPTTTLPRSISPFNVPHSVRTKKPNGQQKKEEIEKEVPNYVSDSILSMKFNVKRGGELIGVDMLLLDSKATLMPGSSPSHHLQTALKGGFYAALMSLEEHFRFRNQNQLLGLANTNTQLLATWTASISPTIEKRRLFLNATSGRQLYFDKETNAEETYFTSWSLKTLGTHHQLHC